MTLRNFLNIVYDETWVKVEFDDEEEHEPLYVWGADWIGGYEQTLKELSPFLRRQVDDLCVVEEPDPERPKKSAQMLNVTLY
jgi:hypothetical protein